MEPAETLASKGWMTDPATRAVMGALTAGGQTVRFVGGCVRDSILGRPIYDIDIATADEPHTVVTLLESAGLKAVPTGIDHGTITAVADGKPFEVTTLRHDVETYGRHAKVAFTDDWVADAARRDFTLNALYCDPDGTVYDPTGGLGDLRAGRVRFVGDAATRITEDYLRILRFFRIHGYFGRGDPDADALAACAAHADQLETLSAERIAGELLRLLEAPDPAMVMGLMNEAGVLGQVLPEAKNLKRLAGLTKLDGVDPDPVRRLAAVVTGDAGVMEALARRLRLSKDHMRRLVALATLPPVSPDGKPVVLRRALYSVGREKFQDDVWLCWAEDPTSTDPGWLRVLNFPDTWDVPDLPVTGKDALGAGIEKGPAVGEALAVVEAWWITEDFQPDRAACLQKLSERAAS
ncbi:MAG: CCA tRNA nucleotidyltransferase [Alphaproteobacteria bacterium]|jgi:poly(A) polymerase|nr:CCA tRNA nucleotidyltransferase [Alphaproteobacteria bacterium]